MSFSAGSLHLFPSLSYRVVGRRPLCCVQECVAAATYLYVYIVGVPDGVAASASAHDDEDNNNFA